MSFIQFIIFSWNLCSSEKFQGDELKMQEVLFSMTIATFFLSSGKVIMLLKLNQQCGP